MATRKQKDIQLLTKKQLLVLGLLSLVVLMGIYIVSLYFSATRPEGAGSGYLVSDIVIIAVNLLVAFIVKYGIFIFVPIGLGLLIYKKQDFQLKIVGLSLTGLGILLGLLSLFNA